MSNCLRIATTTTAKNSFSFSARRLRQIQLFLMDSPYPPSVKSSQTVVAATTIATNMLT